ncbi:MAG: hypothetical protein Q4F71_12105 [Paracoccus sp. (in: a-proteobacteria)]|nr:hypothetical protein [Paracoccus sp. (in: a-proteobacteria)]
MSVRTRLLSIALVSGASVVPAMGENIVQFQTPSGNIHCYLTDGEPSYARCDLMEYRPSLPRPADCELDFGGAFAVSRHGAAEAVCAGDTAASPAAPVLEYGDWVRLGGVACRSERSGVSCTNDDGHGFTLSRARQALH